MKAMIYGDLVALRKPLVETSAVMAALVLVIWLVAFNSPLLILYVAPLEALVALECLALSGEQGPWERGRLALPLSRAQVVRGRYASLAVIVAGTVAGAAFLYLFACAVHFALPALAEALHARTPFEAPLLALVAGGSIAAALFELGLALPFLAGAGAVTGMRFALPALGLALLIGLNALAASGVLAGAAAAFEADPGRAYLLAASLAVLGCAFYAASATISIRRYAKREF